jgi:hypothetical protein
MIKNTPTPVCPYCLHVHSKKKWQQGLDHPSVKDGYTCDPVECAKCHRLFKAVAKVTLTWTTRTVPNKNWDPTLKSIDGMS